MKFNGKFKPPQGHKKRREKSPMQKHQEFLNEREMRKNKKKK